MKTILYLAVFLFLDSPVFSDVPSCSDACSGKSYTNTIVGETLPASELETSYLCPTNYECKCSQGSEKQHCHLSASGPTIPTGQDEGVYTCNITDPC